VAAVSDAFVEVSGLAKRFGEVSAVDGVSFAVRKGEMLVLLGPSGCGKTTILRCLAGLEEPEAGEIRVDGELVTAPRQGILVPPHRRRIGMVFQSYAIWPHLTVFENVAFPLRVRRVPAATVREQAIETLALVGLAGLEDRNATRLSGGQQQRLALARALVFRPRLLLFDEPLSNLDAKLRERMRVELLRLQREVGITAVYVTHDQEEAMTLGDRLVVMHRGRVVQDGDARTLYLRPADPFVADFIGVTNLLRARLSRGPDGWVADIGASDALLLPPEVVAAGESEGWLSVRPEVIQVARHRPPDAANWLTGTLTQLVFLGDRVEGRVRSRDVELRLRIPLTESFGVGDSIYLRIPADHCLVLRGAPGDRATAA
jgi:ABC-type Fe3+/spermidine/putrescine transport system ATPase subunit